MVSDDQGAGARDGQEAGPPPAPIASPKPVEACPGPCPCCGRPISDVQYSPKGTGAKPDDRRKGHVE